MLLDKLRSISELAHSTAPYPASRPVTISLLERGDIHPIGIAPPIHSANAPADYDPTASLLQPFDEAQRSDFFFNGGGFLDLPFQNLDFGLKKLVCLVVPRLHLEPPVNAMQSPAQPRQEASMAAWKVSRRRLRATPGGEQINENHCRNLRIARPHEVRWEGALRTIFHTD